jgi:hypothetical protein
MRKKLGYLALMLCLVVLAITGAPKVASACSGDDCGCGEDVPTCLEGCPPVEDPGHTTCVHSCQVAYSHCAVCCCCTESCPLYC